MFPSTVSALMSEGSDNIDINADNIDVNAEIADGDLESDDYLELWDESQKECTDHHCYVQFHGLRHLIRIYAVLCNLNTTHCYSGLSF